MNVLDRVAAVLHCARIDGGWIDEDVAAEVLKVLGLDEDGHPVQPATDRDYTSSSLGHG